MSGESDHISIANRTGILSGDDHSRGMSDVSQEYGSYSIGNVSEPLPINGPGIGGVTSNYHLRSVLDGQALYSLIIQSFRCFTDLIGDDVIALARSIELATVGKMPAMGQSHTHNRLTGLDKSLIDCIVGCCSGERLHVDENLVRADLYRTARILICSKALSRPPLGQSLNKIHILSALIESPVRIAAIIGKLVFEIQKHFLFIFSHP